MLVSENNAANSFKLNTHRAKCGADKGVHLFTHLRYKTVRSLYLVYFCFTQSGSVTK